MTINNDKTSMPNSDSFDAGDDTPTPRRVAIVRPSPTPGMQAPYSRPMPAQQYQQQRTKALSEQTTVPLTHPSQQAMSLAQQATRPLPPVVQANEATTPVGQGQAAPSMNDQAEKSLRRRHRRGDGLSSPGDPVQQSYAHPIASAQLVRPRRRRLALPILVALVLLTILIAFGAIFQSMLTGKTPPGQAAAQTSSTGPFVRLPLTAMQIDALRHLVGYMRYKQLASMYVARMPLDVELGQLIMVEYSDDYYSQDLDTMINQLHAGGVIMYEFQMKTFDQTKHDIAQMQSRATYPLIISTDEEGGPYVHRLKNIYGLRMSATDIYNTGDINVAIQQGHKVAHDLQALGINENLAPDVDVNLVNGYDMVTRTFGNDPNSVIKFAGAYMQAMQSDGVMACIKHFPGLGDAVNDAHTGLPVVNRTRDQLYSVELAPFKYFIQTQNKLDNPGMIMPTDVLMPAIDPKWPAELSHTFMTDILRKEFGFDGVVLTDALYMKGITDQWSMPEAAVLALNAGNDMLLGPNGVGETIQMLDAIKAALQNGTLSKARVDEAVTRIIALKMAYHLMPAIPPQ